MMSPLPKEKVVVADGWVLVVVVVVVVVVVTVVVVVGVEEAAVMGAPAAEGRD